MTLQFTFNCILVALLSQVFLDAAPPSDGNLQVALERAGGNRSALETALHEVKGKDTEYLLSHASQYDLVNLTAQQIIENITYARKVHAALPYLGEKLEYELWRDWVLPHRVLEEDLSLWRKDLYERMQPVIAGKTSVWEAVAAIHAWWMIGQDGKPPRAVLGPSEDRCKTPLQVMHIGSGGCGDLNMMMVYLLRAVGIPARHCLMCWRYAADQLHYYCEYWDPQLGRWVPVEGGDNKPQNPPVTPQEKSRSGSLTTLTHYAHPGYPATRDSYRTSCFSACVPVTANMFAVRKIGFNPPPGLSGTASAYVWNMDAWRAVAQDAAGGNGGAGRRAIQLADAPASVNRPVLYSVMDGGTLLWGMQRPTPEAGDVELKRAAAGECLRWSGYKGL
jgi:hypothetical protein